MAPENLLGNFEALVLKMVNTFEIHNVVPSTQLYVLARTKGDYELFAYVLFTRHLVDTILVMS